jgi:predicted nuclease with RNAse H fold
MGFGEFGEDEELLLILGRYGPSLVAIDAPLGLPLGLCCLEEGCPCTPTLPHRGRVAEVELARMGIGCFFTTKRSIIKQVVYRGMKLARLLTSEGYQVIEVYPYATKLLLFGKKLPHKTSPLGLAYLKDALSRLIPGLEAQREVFNHHLSDGLLAAYTAYLHHTGQTDTLGIPEEGTIVIPRVTTCLG